MLTDPYHIILEECYISASQEKLLANIPGWEDEKRNQRVLFEFTPSQALSDDSPATKSSSRSRSSDDFRSSGEDIFGVFPGQQPVVWMSPPDNEEEQTPMNTNEVDSYKNAFESDRSQSPLAVSSVIGLGASCRELVFMDMSAQPFTQPSLLSNTPLLDTEAQLCCDDETIPSDVAGDDKGSESPPRKLRCQHDANDKIAQDDANYEIAQDVPVDFSGDTSPLKVGLSGNASPAQAMCENSPKSPSNQPPGEGCRSTPCSLEANNTLVDCEKEQNKKEQRLVLSHVICSPHKVTTKELLAAIEELQEDDDESQEVHEARLFSASSQVPIIPAALLSSFMKSGRHAASLFPPTKGQSLQQLSVSCASESGKTDKIEIPNAEKPKNDSSVHKESCSASQEPEFDVLDHTVKSKAGYHPSESIPQTSSLTEKEVGDHTKTLPKRSAETLRQTTTVIVKKKAWCERAHIFPKTVMDVVWLDSESDDECATGYDFLKPFLKSGLSLPLQLHQ